MAEQVGPHFVQQASNTAGPGFIGSSIHDPNARSRNYRRKSKHKRLRARKKEEKRANHSSQQSLESGYETVGESQASSVTKQLHKGPAVQPDDAIPHNSPLKKLLRDLQRCDVFITKSLSALNKVTELQIVCFIH